LIFKWKNLCPAGHLYFFFNKINYLFNIYPKRKPEGGFIEEPEYPYLTLDEAVVNVKNSMPEVSPNVERTPTNLTGVKNLSGLSRSLCAEGSEGLNFPFVENDLPGFGYLSA
jgi:hypothetical protein